MPEHENITADADNHEPMGLSSLTGGASDTNKLYLSDGAGSGDWKELSAHIGGYVTYDAVTPAYQHSVTTSDTVLDPTFTVTHANLFSATGTPNARLVYNGTPDMHCFMSFNCSVKQASGSNKDVELVIYINGVAQEGSRVVRTTTTANWGSAALNWDAVLSTNDYIEIFTQADAAVTVDYAHAYLGITGSPE